jgi:competence protein ComEA
LQVDRDRITWLGIGLILGLIVFALAFTLFNRTQPAPIFISPPAPTATQQPTSLPGPLRIYISGEVLQPDVYELPEGAILRDAVNAAGGFTADAMKSAVNLALPLSDGMHVHVPGATGEPVVVPATGGVVPDSPSTGGVININTAGLDELDRLPGIGPSIAQRIIDYRQENGLFTSIEGVQDVSGIGPAKYEQMKDLISAE